MCRSRCERRGVIRHAVQLNANSLEDHFLFSNSLIPFSIFIMNTLTVLQIQNLLASAEPAPILEPTSAQIQHHKCPICLTFKPSKLALHQACFRAICLECILDLLEDRASSCPFCNLPMRESPTSEPSVIRLLPADHFILDNIDYFCDSCDGKFKIAEARIHPTTCSRLRRPPVHPHHRPSRPLQQLVRHEVVSNPVIKRQPNLSNEPPIIMRVNGNRLPVRQFPRWKTIGFLRNKLAKVAKVAPGDLKIFFFSHLELNDNIPINQLACTTGQLHLSATTSSTKLGEETANLILESPGEPPVQPRRPAQDFDANQWAAAAAAFQQEQQQEQQDEAHPFINPWLD